MTHAKSKLIFLLLMAVLFPGCARMALYAAPDLVPNLTGAFFEECDPALAREALPAELKLMEGLLKNAPQNEQLLTALCMGFSGYAMLFIEEEDPARASTLYRRARAYGMRALGIKALTSGNIDDKLAGIGKESIQPLFWTTLSWNGWIRLNLDNPSALGQLDMAQKCLDRVMEIDPDVFHGAPYIVYGALLASKPKMLGGDPARAAEYFSKAVAVSHGKFFLAQYYYAKTYAVRIQDKKLFSGLVKAVEAARPDDIKDACLINTVMKQKMKALSAAAEDLFF
ncbi:MAG: TRAP transporter TatT component family protein [Desulfatiglandaceae bacterium]